MWYKTEKVVRIIEKKWVNGNYTLDYSINICAFEQKKNYFYDIKYSSSFAAIDWSNSKKKNILWKYYKKFVKLNFRTLF